MQCRHLRIRPLVHLYSRILGELMRIVVDINHPGHVHYFKQFIWEMKERGHDVLITASEKDITFKLLENYHLDFENMGTYGTSLISKLANIPIIDIRYYQLMKSFKPDIFVGFGSIRAAHVSFLLRKPCINFEDTEHSTEQIRLYLPFVDAVCTPSCYTQDLGKKQIRFDGYMELASLHPNYFNPDPAVLTELGLDKDDNIFLVRFAAFDASHDTKTEHFDKRYIPNLISKLEDKGTVVISSEIKLNPDLQKYQYRLSPDRYHDLLYFSKMYVGEGSTSALEAAVLGTPAINFERIVIKGKKYSFADFSDVIAEFQNKYGLINCYYDEVMMLEKIDEYIDMGFDIVKLQAKENKERLLNDTIDVTKFMIWFIENYPQSFNQMRENPKIQDKFSNRS